MNAAKAPWHPMTEDALPFLCMNRRGPTVAPGQGTLKCLQLESARLIALEASTATLALKEPREDRSDIIVLQQVTGEACLTSGAKFFRLHPGDLALIDLSSPFELSAWKARSCRLLWLVPDARTGDLSSLTSLGPTHIDGSEGAGALASECLSTFVDQCAQLESEVAGSLLRSLLGIIDTAVLTAAGAEARCTRKRAFHLRRIKRFVFDHLRDPALNPSGIAEATGVSRRYLDDLFSEEETSINRFLWTQRLEGAARNLEDPTLEHRRITEIAFSWGFNSASHFSRTFSERFSMSPSQYRSQAARRRASRLPLDGAAAG